MCVNPKIGGFFSPKMDGENHGSKLPIKMGCFGGYITPISIFELGCWHSQDSSVAKVKVVIPVILVMTGILLARGRR